MTTGRLGIAVDGRECAHSSCGDGHLGRMCRALDRVMAGITTAGWISEAVWKTRGSGRIDEGRDEASRESECREAGKAMAGAGKGDKVVGQDTS